MTSTSLWIKLVNPGPTKNNKLTALSPVYKVHTHLSLIRAQVYIYEIALQPVKITGKHSYRVKQHGTCRLPPVLSSWRAPWGQTCRGDLPHSRIQTYAPFSLSSFCKPPLLLLPCLFFSPQNEYLLLNRFPLSLGWGEAEGCSGYKTVERFGQGKELV